MSVEYASATIPVNTMVFIVQDGVPMSDSYYDLRSYVESYIEKSSIPSKLHV